jgi:hypothetical protein
MDNPLPDRYIVGGNPSIPETLSQTGSVLLTPKFLTLPLSLQGHHQGLVPRDNAEDGRIVRNRT